MNSRKINLPPNQHGQPVIQASSWSIGHGIQREVSVISCHCPLETKKLLPFEAVIRFGGKKTSTSVVQIRIFKMQTVVIEIKKFTKPSQTHLDNGV